MRLPWQRGADERTDLGTRSATLLRDERLSEYLDGLLSRPDAVAIEANADHDSEARLALEGMRAVRAHLGELGMARAPRSFMLTPQNAPRQRGLPRLELYARLATAAAVLALTVSTLQPSSTGIVNERATTSMSESLESAAPNEARKQGAERAPQPATVAADTRAAAPTSAGAPGVAGAAQPTPPSGALGAAVAPQAPAPGESLATAAAASVPSEAGATATPATAPSLPPPSEQPVPLSNGVAQTDPSLSVAQVGLAAITAVLFALSLGLWLRRARGF